MANPNELIPSQNTPDTPEQARERELLRTENEKRAHERDLASIDAMLDANPSKETIERILRKIVEKMPEERTNLERMSVGADIQVLEVIAKNDPSNPEVTALLQNRKKRHQELSKSSEGIDVHEEPKTNVIAHSKPKESTSNNPIEYPLGTKVLSAAEARKVREAGKTALEGKTNKTTELSPEDRKLLEKKVGQANLLLSTAEAYRDYLSNLEAHIRFKNISDKPKRYRDQVRAIDSVLSELGSIASMPEYARAEALKKLDVKTLADRVLVSEPSLSTFGSGFMNQPMFEIDAETGEKRIMPNIASTLAETEGRYAKMKAIVTEGNDFSSASVQKKKYEILGLLRSNDSRDDDSLRLNSWEAIAKQVEGDVLQNPKLRENGSIRQVFDTILAMQSDQKTLEAVQSFMFEPSVANARSFELFFQAHGIDLPKDTLNTLAKKAVEYRSAEGTITEKQVSELSKSVDRPGAFPAEFVREFKKDPIGTTKRIFEQDAASKVFSLAKREIIAGALQGDIRKVRELRKTDPALALYTNIEGITHTPDSTVNERVDTSSWVLEQTLIMYSAWLLWNAIARISYVEKPVEFLAKGAKLRTEALVGAGRTANLAGKSAELVGTTITEWVPFAVAYSTLNGLANQGYMSEWTLSTIKETFSASNNLSDNSRIVAFLAVIKTLLPVISKMPNPQSAVEGMLAREFPELALKIAKNPVASKGLELSRTGIQIGQNVMLDTAALLGADTVIRWIRGEDLPKNSSEIPNYLMQEFQAIIAYVVGLQTLTGTMANGPKPVDMAASAQRQIEVNYQKNGDIAIRALEGKLVVIKKELRYLDQAHDRLKNGGTSKLDSHTIATGKREKKAELRWAVADVESMHRELAMHESGITVSQANAKSGEGAYEDATAGIGAPKKYSQSVAPDENFGKTSTNHTANNLKGLDIDPRNITLGETMSGFSSSLDTAAIGKKFSELLSGMKNIESPELLQKQAETVIQGELQAKYDAIMKDYSQLTPEAQQAMDTWRESMEWQARELANDFQNALRTKLEGGRMDRKFGNSEYLDRIMGTFTKEMSETLKKSMSDTWKDRQKFETLTH